VVTVSQAFRVTLAVVGTLAGLYILYEARGLVLLFFGALLFASTIRPIVSWFQKRGMAISYAILLVYLATLSIIVAFIIVVLPTVLNLLLQLMNSQAQFVQTAHGMMLQLSAMVRNQLGVVIAMPSDGDLTTALENARTEAIKVLGGTWQDSFRTITDLVLLFTIAFYWLTTRDRLEDLMLRLVPLRHRDRVQSLFNEIEQALGAFVRGQGLLMVTMAILVLAGMTLLGIPYALLLALFAGICEAIPIVGPILGGIPALAVALMFAPDKVIFVLVLYVAFQQFESAILVPKIMERQVGVRPLMVVLALTAGSQLGGLTGALVAVPVAATLQILTQRLVIEPTVQARTATVVEGAVLVGEPEKGTNGEAAAANRDVTAQPTTERSAPA
jgi:predicted PurR-regulated permease PerM